MKNRAISINEIRNQIAEYFNHSYYNSYEDVGQETFTHVHEMMIGEDGGVFCIYETDGIYYMTDVSLQDGMIELSNVREVFDRINPEIRIVKQPDNKYRWFGIVGTAVLNRIGVFDSKDLFDSFEKNFGTLPLPFYTLVHAGEELRIGNVDWISRYQNTMLGSGLFDDTDIATRARLAIEKEPDYWGNSVGFWNSKELLTKSNDNRLRAMYKEGKLKEISLLPEKYAAHHFTNILSFTDLEKETRMSLSNVDVLKETLKRMGYDDLTIEKMADTVVATNRSITDNNLEVRMKEETPETPAPVEAEKEEEIRENKENAQIDLSQFELEISDELIRAISEPIEANFTTRLNELQALFETRMGELKSGYEAELVKIQNRIKGIETDDQEQIQQIVQDLPAKIKSKPVARFVPRSLVDEKQPDRDMTLPDTSKAGWAAELAKQNLQKTKITQ